MMYRQFATFYDQLMDLDYAAYLETWQMLTSFQGKVMLEYGCGTGNVTKELIPLVQSIDAADPSPDMLMLAQRKIQSPKCHFYLIEDGSFETSKTYDMIGLFVDVMNYLTPSELADLLAEWYDRLPETGEIVFDVSSHDKLANQLGDQVFYYETSDGELFWVNQYDPDQMVLEFSLIMYQTENGVNYVRHEENHIQYVYTPDMIRQLAPQYDIMVKETPERIFFRLRKKTAL